MPGNFSVIWVLVVLLPFINVSSPADTVTPDTSTNNGTICADSVNCTCLSDTIQCRGLTSLGLLPLAASPAHLVLQDSHIPVLNASLLQSLPQLQSLEAVNCGIQQITGTWYNPHLQDINLSNNMFSTFHLKWLDGLPGLHSLNLSGSPLHSVSGHTPVETRLQSLDIRGHHWNCTNRGMMWLVDWLHHLPPPRSLAGARDTLCLETRKQYLTMHRQPLLDVLLLTDEMLEQCPSAPPFSCFCDLTQVVVPPLPTPAPASTAATPSSTEWSATSDPAGSQLTPAVVEVYCDNRQLTKFPPMLPMNTITLYIRNNKLTGFGEVLGNLSGYQSLTSLYLDGNLLDDAYRLEGSDFFERFSILSLANNRLETLPVHAFEAAFQKPSSNVDSLFLGGNPWLCDCDSPFTFEFQTWMVSQRKLIRDLERIRCGSGPLATGSPSGPPLPSLDWRKLCGKVTVNPWDLVLVLLGIVVVALMVKLVYDVTVYRRSGELPLLVRKLPW